jgi:RHS repeat-associated protein
VSTITDPFTGLAKTAYTYDGAGRVLSRTDTAGLTLTNSYDAAGRLSTAVTKTPGNVAVSSYGYSYDSASNVTAYSQTLPAVSGQANPDSGSWAYTYNQREELATAKLGSSPTLTYAYNDSGDRTSVQVGAGTPTTTGYDGADRVSAVGSTAYTWDAADELTNVGSSRTYAYDAWGRTTSATVGATTVGYAYDALDRTMSRTPSSGSATSYAYTGLGQSIASATTGAAQPVLLAYRQEGPMAQKQGSTIRAYEQDPHDDLSVVTDTTGTPTGAISYDPWGTVDGAIGTDAQQSLLGYQSQPTDPSTGLTDMGTRLYDPAMGRFTERDVVFRTPTNPLTLNQYAYGADKSTRLRRPHRDADPMLRPHRRRKTARQRPNRLRRRRRRRRHQRTQLLGCPSRLRLPVLHPVQRRSDRFPHSGAESTESHRKEVTIAPEHRDGRRRQGRRCDRGLLPRRGRNRQRICRVSPRRQRILRRGGRIVAHTIRDQPECG